MAGHTDRNPSAETASVAILLAVFGEALPDEFQILHADLVCIGHSQCNVRLLILSYEPFHSRI